MTRRNALRTGFPRSVYKPGTVTIIKPDPTPEPALVTSSTPLCKRYTVTATPNGVEHYTIFVVTRRDGVVIARDISAPDIQSMDTHEGERVRRGEIPKLAIERDDFAPL